MLEVGQKYKVEQVFHQEDFDRFASLTRDDNPIHVDPKFAATTRFGRTLCHGMLLFSALSAAIRSGLGGPGAVILDQQLKFPGPCFADDRLIVDLEVLDRNLLPDQIALISGRITSSDGGVCCEGQTRVQIPRSEGAS